MKRHIIYLAAVLGLLSMNSCSLDEYNPSAISTDEEWSSASGYEKLVNGCYYDLVRIIYGQAEDTYIMCSEAGTDIWQDVNSGDNGNWSKVLTYPSDFGADVNMFQEAYSGFYGCLSQCNAAVIYADKVEGLTEDEKNSLLAEAKFVRAHCLFNLVEYFGGKYLPTGLVTSAITSLPMSKVNDFYDLIFDDLQFAMEYLPVDQTVIGHAKRAAAYHLYAKACLTYSTYTDGLGNCDAITASESQQLLQNAKEAADYLIENQSELGVSLYDECEEVFADENNKTNKEAIFVVTHSTVRSYNPRGNYYNRSWKHWTAYANNTAGIFLDGITPSYETEVNGVTVPKLAKSNCYMAPSKYMLDLYGEKDTRYKAYFDDTYYINNPNNTDSYRWTSTDAERYGLDASRVDNPDYDIPVGDTAIFISRDKTYTQAEKDACRYAIYNVEDNYADQTNPGKFYPSLRKNNNPTYYEGTNPSKPYSSGDCIVYRLAETYLLSAEIDWRLGDNQSAAERLNVIRNRACENHDHSMDVTADDVDQDLLLDEDARELIGEWQRWQTLKRFRAFESRIAKCNPQITEFKSEYYLRPVNTSEILLIDNADEYQNDGY
jgi:hypothetical protein